MLHHFVIIFILALALILSRGLRTADSGPRAALSAPQLSPLALALPLPHLLVAQLSVGQTATVWR